jgi:hypothetical protein
VELGLYLYLKPASLVQNFQIQKYDYICISHWFMATGDVRLRWPVLSRSCRSLSQKNFGHIFRDVDDVPHTWLVDRMARAGGVVLSRNYRITFLRSSKFLVVYVVAQTVKASGPRPPMDNTWQLKICAARRRRVEGRTAKCPANKRPRFLSSDVDPATEIRRKKLVEVHGEVCLTVDSGGDTSCRSRSMFTVSIEHAFYAQDARYQVPR